MEIVIFDSNLEKKDIVHNPTRVGCRGIVKHNDHILVVHEEKWNITTLPGGGLEPAESIEECVIREIKEETGVDVIHPVETVRIVEHFQTESFISIYFTCEFVRETNETAFTEVERDVNLQKKWMDVYDLMDLLSNEPSRHEHGPNIHNREFIGLINSL